MYKRYFVRRTIAVAVAASMMLAVFGSSGKAVDAGESIAAEAAINESLKLWYTEPANIATAETSGGDWMQQSLPLGNGNLGNLIFGGITKERIHFNEKTLWTGGPSSNRPNYQFGNKSTAYTAEEIEAYRQVLDDKSRNVFNDSMSGYGYVPIRFPGESNLNKGSYQDFGDLWLDYSAMGITDANVTNYRRELDLQTAIAKTEFTYQDVVYTREHFVSSPDQVMVTRLTASEAGKLDVKIQMELNNSGLTGTTSLETKENTCTIDGYVKDNGLKFRTTMKILPAGGTITANTGNQTYTVSGADSILIVMAAETNYKNDYPTYRDTEKNLTTVVNDRIKAAAEKSYEALKEAHLEDHQELFDRVSLDLGEVDAEIPTNELMDQYRQGAYSKYLEILSFQFGRYLTIAGSRGTLPSNLVGLWTVGDSAWTGDYHFNINVQMNYWPVYVTNLAECGVTMVEYMENLREPGRLTAERVHGIQGAVENHTGFVVHTENNPFGMTAPSNAQEYGWNPTGAAWAIQNLWAHYEFTRDEAYLEEVIYPIMKEAALFWDQYLWTSGYQVINDEESPYDGEARVVVAPSFSEEQGPTAVGTTYDQSLVWELYKECIEAGTILGEDDELLAQWEETMQKLDPIEINATNGIKEWYEETRVGTESGHHKSYAQAGNLAEIAVPNSGWNIGHPGEQRHASHLVGLYPGTLISKENETYMEAAVQSLTERGEYSTGWSKANKINLWARTGNGEKAYKLLNNLIGGKSSGLQYNLFDSHGSGGGETMMNGTPVWQIDGNYGLTAGVAEMLLQSQLGYVQFLPAIPESWDEGNVQGLKARGNFTIGQSWYNGVPESFTVCYDGEGSSVFNGEYANITDAKVYANGKKVSVKKDRDNERISFEATAGVVYTIDMAGVNNDQVKEHAETYLLEIHPDLSAAKAELQKAIAENDKNLNEILRKVKLMNRFYEEYLENAQNIYYMTAKEGLAIEEIDQMYHSLMQYKTALLEDNQEYEFYENTYGEYQEIAKILQEQMGNRKITFSIPSGIITTANAKLTLSKSSEAKDYVIRYTLDGSEPNAQSELYQTAISLRQNESKAVRAALFLDAQRVSPVYMESYGEKVTVSSVETSVADWGNEYVPNSMIDGNSATRWASYEPSGDVEIYLSFNQEKVISAMTFEQYVSYRNGTYGFEIWALQDGDYAKVYEGEKLGDDADNLGNYFATKTISFDPVKTAKIKIVIKDGYLGEPSFYEIQPMYSAAAADAEGNRENLDKLLEKAESINQKTAMYQNLAESLRGAFEDSILEAKEADGNTQSETDSLEVFLNNRYERVLEGIAAFVGPDVSEVFSDVKGNAWYVSGVQYVYDNGLMSGSNGLFNPTADITRAQIVTTLYRLAGEPEVTDAKALTDFTDVAEGKYYTDAVCWAYANGVATGNNGKFDPTGKLTRQQMAAFFFRFAEVSGMDTTVRGEISSMVNADKVSGYAKEPVQWAVGAGLISGSDVTVNGVARKDLNPRGNTTRAQVATILMRFCSE